MPRPRENATRMNRFISAGPILPQPKRTQAAEEQNAAEINGDVQERRQRQCAPGKGETGREDRAMAMWSERPEQIRRHGAISIAAGSGQIDDLDTVHPV